MQWSRENYVLHISLWANLNFVQCQEIIIMETLVIWSNDSLVLWKWPNCLQLAVLISIRKWAWTISSRWPVSRTTHYGHHGLQQSITTGCIIFRRIGLWFPEPTIDQCLSRTGSVHQVNNNLIFCGHITRVNWYVVYDLFINDIPKTQHEFHSRGPVGMSREFHLAVDRTRLQWMRCSVTNILTWFGHRTRNNYWSWILGALKSDGKEVQNNKALAWDAWTTFPCYLPAVSFLSSHCGQIDVVVPIGSDLGGH